MGWLRRQLEELQGNAKYDLAKYLLFALLAGVVALGVWFVRYLTALSHGFTLAQQRELLTWFVALILLVVATTTWAVVASRYARQHQWPSSAVSLPPVPMRPTLSPLAPRLPLVPDLWDIEIREVIYSPQKGGYLATQCGWYILMNIAIANKGIDEASVKDWHVEVGSDLMTARVTNLPQNWYIEREEPTTLGFAERIEEIARPTLDKMLESDGLPRARTRVGWILFELTTPRRCPGPHNLPLRLVIRDAMDHIHSRCESLDALYEARGEIKVHPSTWAKPVSS
jgi:hypothetical protein